MRFLKDLDYSVNAEKNTLAIFIFSIVASFVSQTLVDFADILLVFYAFLFAYKQADTKRLLTGFRPFYFMFFWLAVVFIGLIINTDFKNLKVWSNFVEYKWIITLLCAIYLATRIKRQFELNQRLLLPILLLNVISIILNIIDISGQRAAGVLNAVMAFSHNIAPVFCFYFICFFTKWTNLQTKEGNLNLLVVVTSGLLTIMTMTRGVWLGAAVAITIGLVLWDYKKAIRVLAGLVVAVVILFFASTSIQKRVLSKTYAETSSNEVRLALWKANLLMVRDYPVFGVGHGQNKNHLNHYFDELGIPQGSVIISHAHNQYLQVWAGTGTLGLLCYLFFLYTILRTTWRGYQQAPIDNKGLMLGLMAALLCFMIGALTEANFNISKNRFLFLILAGLAIGFSNQITQRKSPR